MTKAVTMRFADWELLVDVLRHMKWVNAEQHLEIWPEWVDDHLIFKVSLD